jgi:hypothetical protein
MNICPERRPASLDGAWPATWDIDDSKNLYCVRGIHVIEKKEGGDALDFIAVLGRTLLCCGGRRQPLDGKRDSRMVSNPGQAGNCSA